MKELAGHPHRLDTPALVLRLLKATPIHACISHTGIQGTGSLVSVPDYSRTVWYRDYLQSPVTALINFSAVLIGVTTP